MRRDIGGKTDGYARRTVDQKIGETSGQHIRLEYRVVEVPRPTHRVLVYIAQKLERERREPRLGITHSRRTVAVDRAEVTVPVHEHRTHIERLRHSHHCLVNGAVAVRVELTQAVAYDTRALFIRFVGRDAELLHGIQYTTLNGLQSVLDARQRTVEYDRFRIRDHGIAHNVFHCLKYYSCAFLFLFHSNPYKSYDCICIVVDFLNCDRPSKRR